MSLVLAVMAQNPYCSAWDDSRCADAHQHQLHPQLRLSILAQRVRLALRLTASPRALSDHKDKIFQEVEVTTQSRSVLGS